MIIIVREVAMLLVVELEMAVFDGELLLFTVLLEGLCFTVFGFVLFTDDVPPVEVVPPPPVVPAPVPLTPVPAAALELPALLVVLVVPDFPPVLLPGEGESVLDKEADNDGDGDGVGAQGTRTIVFVSIVTAALRTNARPLRVAPLENEMDTAAKMVPSRWLTLPRVAELLSCQKTLQAWAPFVRTILLAEAVMRVDCDWKRKTLLVSPWPSKVSVVVI